ncbi:MAG: phosphatase PAP2 family protein [Bacteroidetes bacterium]|nr:phosphatase PAP2 family protein [Bacteroidota bacterium]
MPAENQPENTNTATKLRSKFFVQYNSIDFYVLGLSSIYIVLSVVFFNEIKWASRLIGVNVLIGIMVTLLAYYNSRRKSLILDVTHNFYIIPMVLVMFNQVFYFIPVVHPHDYDTMLIAWDRAIFGVNPTEVLLRFSNPYLTEFLQLCYMSFFFHGLAQGIEMYVGNRKDAVKTIARQIGFGYFVSYILYFVFPAIGPRFTVHDFATLSTDLPGLWLTEPIRHFINAGDNIGLGELYPALVVNRDCMPSGHTMMTVMNIIISFQLRSKQRWIFLVIGSCLIFSTVYLRYHYAVDVIAGIICAIIVMWLEPKLWRKLLAKKWVVN